MRQLQVFSSIFQSIPSFRGKRRLCKAIIDLLRLKKAKNFRIKTKNGLFELPNLIEVISMDLFINGSYENGLVKLLTNNIPINGVFVDIGANIGTISIPLALARPDVKIVALEASPWIFRILERNIALNNIKSIKAKNCAVFDESNKEMPIYAPKELFGKGSLMPVYTKDAELIGTLTIDDIASLFQLSRMDWLKVDVEGFEAAVFKGMSIVASTFKPSIIFEFSSISEVSAGFQPGESQSVLISKGYSIQNLTERFVPVGEPQKSIFTGDYTNLLAKVE